MLLKRQIPLLIFAVTAIGLHLVAAGLQKEFCLVQLTMALYYAIVVMGLCVVMGYAGQVSLGHGAFFAAGGYTSAVLTTHDFSQFGETACGSLMKRLHFFVAQNDPFGNTILTATPWAAFLAAMLGTFIMACLIGYPALRLKGHYLAMATLGFGVIVHKILLGSTITGAADGISNVPEWNLGLGLVVTGKSVARVQNYYIACGVALLLLFLLRNLVQSRVGRALQAIHEREAAANAIGINTASYKLQAFVLSALLAALAGVLCTHFAGGIGPAEASTLKSVRYVSLAAAGGMANLWGVTLVSVGINYLSLRDWFGSYDNAVFGLILITTMSITPEGPLKPLGNFIKRILTRRVPREGNSHGAP